jgi:hypothetical protein
MTDCTCGEPATMDDTCADCFWEEDARLKRKHRSDPNWIFQRRYSSAITLLNRTPEEAWILAMQGWIRYHVGIHLGMSHETALHL